jgi:RhtB (resistance to homoserine/threonine) family protein
VELLPVLVVAAVVVVTPGVDMALVTRNALLHGRQSALATALGINLGIAFWSVAAALGLAAVVAASAAAFTAIKLAGAAYLIYLGVQALRSSGAHAAERLPAAGGPVRRVGFRQGVVSNLLNPKIAVFFTSLLPQFVGTDGSTAARLLLLGALFNVMGIVWLSAYALAVTRARALFGRPRVRRAIERASGVVLIGLGVRLAVESRR